MIQLTERTNGLLEVFAREGLDYHMAIEELQSYDLRPARALHMRGYIAFGRKGAHITKEGLAAWDKWHNPSLTRKDPTMPLSHYFDSVAYGLPVVRKKRAKAKRTAPRKEKPFEPNETVRQMIDASLFRHSA